MPQVQPFDFRKLVQSGMHLHLVLDATGKANNLSIQTHMLEKQCYSCYCYSLCRHDVGFYGLNT